MDNIEEKISKIVAIAVHAPSGENSQPWRFAISGQTLSVYNTPDADTSYYNVEQRGSHVAHGALIENLHICASRHGLIPSLSLFPDTAKPDLVATIEFTLATPRYAATDHLYESVPLRSTNRKMYIETPLSSLLREKLDALNTDEEPNLVVLEDRKKVSEIASLVSLNERLLFQIPAMFDFFFSHIRWNTDEEAKNPRGFYIKTLELGPPEVFVMKLLHRPVLFQLFSILGIANKIATENASRYRSASAICTISSSGDTKEDMVNAGRLLQRALLTVTKEGWSAQPMSGLLFLYHALSESTLSILSSSQHDEIVHAYEALQVLFGVKKENKLIMIFRVGKASLPSASAKKVAPQISITH